MQRRTILLGISSVAALLLIALMFTVRNRSTLKGSIITPPWPAPEINLTDHNGQPFRLSDHRGEVVLLYFGYVNCPDECPLTMANQKVALENLGDRAKDVQVIMVSTDPARDTPQALKEYMEHFDPAFLALTGTVPELEKVWKDYGVTVEEGGETHSLFLYVIDPAGNVRETFLPDSLPADLARDVNLLLMGR